MIKVIKYNQEKGIIRDDIDATVIAIFLEGAGFYMKKFIIEQALQNMSTTLEIDIEYFKKAMSQFWTLLKEGIGKK